MKNVERFETHEEAENAFLVECWDAPATNKMIPWSEWDDEMKCRYRLWLFEEAPANMGKVNWTPNANNECSACDLDPATKTFSNTKTIYWTNPPCFDNGDTNNSTEDYDKVAREAVDAWFNSLKQQTGENKEYLNKDRFDDFNTAWNCFEFECDCNGFDSFKDKAFAHWLFYPYKFGEKRMFSKSLVVNNLRKKFETLGYSEDLTNENKKLRKFIQDMFNEFPLFSFVQSEPVYFHNGRQVSFDGENKDGSK